jgi:flagellar hook-basal body protein
LTLTAANSGSGQVAVIASAVPVAATKATDSITFTAMAIGDSVTVNGLTYTATTALTADQAAAAFSSTGITAAIADTTHVNYVGTWDGTKYDPSVSTATTDGTGVLSLTAATAGAGLVGLSKAVDTITFGAMAIGDSVTVNGLTYTATSALTADQAASKFNTSGLSTAAGAGAAAAGYTGSWGGNYSSIATTDGSGVLALTAASAGAGKTSVSVTATPATLTTATDAITFGAMAIGDSVTVNGLTYTATSALTADQAASKFNTAGLTTAAGAGAAAAGYTRSWDAAYSSTATTNGSGVLTLTAATAGAGQTAAAVSKTGTTTVSGSFTQGIDVGTVTAAESGFVQGTSVALTATPRILASATDTVSFSQMAPGDSVTMAGLTFTNNTANTITSNQVALKFTAAAIAANSGLNTNGYSGTFDTTNFTAASATSGVGLNEIVISSVAQGATAQNLAPGSVIAHQMHSNQTVTAVSVGGALAGSAPAGTYTLGSVSMMDGVSGDATPAMLPIGGIAGVYTVNLSGGTGRDAQAIINYSGSGIITGIALNGGQNYSVGDVLNISAGSLGAGSTGFSLAALTAPQVVTGTYMTLSSGVGPALRSSQPIQDGVVGQTQNFDFANGVSMSINNSGSVVDTITTIANSFNNKTITVSNQPTGTMAFVAGKNIDSLSRDQFGKPAYNTRTTISTSVGSGTLKNMLSINIDSTNMTAYSSAAQTYDNSTDGNPMAQLTAYSIDNAGKLVANYDNGITVVKGQLAIANFNNTEGLIPVGANSYERSGTDGMGSGPVIYGTANSGNLGAIRAKAVESSNVDLTAELVKLMTLQRLYSANSQAVKIEAATIVDDAIRLGQ